MWNLKYNTNESIRNGKSHGQRSLVGYAVQGVAKSRIQLRDQGLHFKQAETDSETWRSDFWLPTEAGVTGAGLE